ncbi:MAG: mitochondrial fission ELM1 family protein [Pseudomonadota bacterium]
MTEMRRLVVWAVSDGRAGMENQVLGIAEALQRRIPASIVNKRIVVDKAFERLPRFLWGNPFDRLSTQGDKLEPPWPDVFIGCGRRVVPYAMALQSQCFTVQTQDPRAPAKSFGLVVPPVHDEMIGQGILPIQGSPNRLTKDKLKVEATLLAASLPDEIRFKSPFAAALIGGPSKSYRWNKDVEEGIISALASTIEAGYAVLATLSRRTPPHFRKRLEYAFKSKKLWLWDGEPLGPIDNPYFGLLGLAERILVSEESANMITEAAFTGKPVHLLQLQGGGKKWDRFHTALAERGVIRPGAGMDESWSYAPLRETERVADEIIRSLTRRGVIDPIA